MFVYMKNIFILFCCVFINCISIFSQYNAPDFILNGSNTIQIRHTFVKDTVFDLPVGRPITGLSISGNAILTNEENSSIRVVLIDNYNIENLVYEVYPRIANSKNMPLINVGLETILLDNVVPVKLRIEITESVLLLNSVNFSINNSVGPNFLYRKQELIESQNDYVIRKLNDNLTQNGELWRAGKTSLSELSYDDKKDVFGGTVPNLHGYEYYIGGIFTMPNYDAQYNSELIATEVDRDKYIKEWDWRNRHGRNWMTDVKNQGGCGSCWAFAANGALEAYINLYYNCILNMDLSEQELVSCYKVDKNGNPIGCSGGSPGGAIDYISENGIVLEECFPYSASNLSCENKCQTPSNIISITNPSTYFRGNSKNEFDLKKILFTAPTTFGIISWNHALVLCGYKTIEAGDRIYFINNEDKTKTWITIPEGHELIGSTAWLLKNSHGKNFGMEGYSYVVINWSDLYCTNSLSGKIVTQSHSDDNIFVSDEDGDGFYFWGLGERPLNLPGYIPLDPDGDDNNLDYGPLDSFGNLQVINPEILEEIIIRDTQILEESQYYHQNIVISNGGCLVIKNMLLMHPKAAITIMNGGKLIVDSGLISHVQIITKEGGSIELKNNGKIDYLNSNEFEVVKGAKLKVSHGEISNK